MEALAGVAVFYEQGTPVFCRRTLLCQEHPVAAYRGTSPIRNSTPPEGRHRALEIFLLWRPRGALLLMSEAPLYTANMTFPKYSRSGGPRLARRRLPLEACDLVSPISDTLVPEPSANFRGLTL